MDADATVTANRRFVEVRFFDEATTVTFILELAEASDLATDITNAVAKLREISAPL